MTQCFRRNSSNWTRKFLISTFSPEAILEIDDISEYNQKEGLALNAEEVEYLENLSKKLGRKLTDSEVFGFSQVNSEHCRHKIFNGTFEIDGKEMPSSLFKLIKKTSAETRMILFRHIKTMWLS